VKDVDSMTTSSPRSARPAESPVAEPFQDFLLRVRTGDESAALELVKRYEPAIRMEIRLRLGDPRLRRLLEPADISQSVLRSFFARAASGQFDLDSPERLLGLLLTMARNKVAYQARKQKALRRDKRREVSVHGEQIGLPAHDPSPSRQLIGREMLTEIQSRLSEEERRMADLRSEGCGWADIAEEMGGSAQARRKQLARAVNRAARAVGYVEDDDE
jgi:RNA polymerase sigma factor (sigma-70 family)